MVDKDTFLDVLDEIEGLRGTMADAQTRNATAYKAADEEHGINRWALKQTATLRRMDEAKRKDRIRSLWAYLGFAGLLDTSDILTRGGVGYRPLTEGDAHQMGRDAAHAGRSDTDIEDAVYQVAALTRAWREGYASYCAQAEDATAQSRAILDNDGVTDSDETQEEGVQAAETEEGAAGPEAEWQAGAGETDTTALDQSGKLFNDGADAAREGKPKSANPHDKGSPAYKLWGKGFAKEALARSHAKPAGGDAENAAAVH